MRIAFATNPALGHVLPLLPLAHAAREAGHDVVFLGGASVAGPLGTAGFRHVEAGPPDLPTAFARVPERAGLTGRRLAAMTWGRVFGGVIAPDLAAALLALAREWRPDLVVHEDSEQGTWIAAERLGIPHVTLQATAWRGAGVRLSAGPLGELRTALGLRPDPDLERWHRHGYLATRPPLLQDPADPLPSTAVPLRPVAIDEVAGDVPGWLDRRPEGRPRVAVTLGTILPGRLDAIRVILDGLSALDAEVVATVGPGLDPAALGEWTASPERPAAIHVTRYVPMSRLLATSDALVFHGGSGTMLAAAALGVPVVVLPDQADQPENADRCEAAGIGVQLAPAERSPDAIADATKTVLADATVRAAASAVRAQIAGMPSPPEVLAALEALADAGPDGVIAGR